MRTWKVCVLLLIIIGGFAELKAQQDTIIMVSGEILLGEIKLYDNGIVTIETGYSDSDFKVEGDKVEQISTFHKYVILTAQGKRYYGSLASDKDNPSIVLINDAEKGRSKEQLKDILFLKKIDQTFWSRLDFLISIGYTLTKANNNQQFSGNLKTGYTSSKFKSDLSIGAIRTFQEDEEYTSRTSRTDAGLGFLFFVVKDWFAVARTDLLQSSEQQLNLRAITKGGIGNFVLKTNRMNLGLAGGAAWNYENYSQSTANDKNSAEAFAALEYNIFDIGDLDLLTKLVAYPSLTERKRFRTDFSFNMKYEFKRDFFINLGLDVNYDNQPAEGSSPFDYVLQTTFGWEL
jgi:hypothetical protein